MRKSSTLGREMAQGASELQSVNGFHHKPESPAFSFIVHASRAMDEIIDKIERSRHSLAPVLITGETGTGKELIARAIHAVSSRHVLEFIPFNCGCVGPELVESELFGYRRGAFTGADRDSKGVIREANGGSLFLDEIGELPLAAQPQLLRFLQEGEVRPLGVARPIKVNVRLIAATNRDLEADIQAGRFRPDLFERLNALRVRVPPLRERREDIPLLIEHFLQNHARKMGKQGLRLSAEARNALISHDWPRNVRELENAVYRLVAFADDYEEIGQSRVLDEIGVCARPTAATVIGDSAMISLNQPLHEARDNLERLLVEHALKVTGGNRVKAAARLKIHRDGLRKMIERLGINVR